MGGVVFPLITRFKLGQNALRLDQPKANFFLLVVAAHVPTVLVEQLNARRRNACFLLVLEL